MYIFIFENFQIDVSDASVPVFFVLETTAIFARIDVRGHISLFDIDLQSIK